MQIFDTINALTINELTWLHPEFLLFMLLPVVIFFYFILTHKQSQEQFFSQEVLEKLHIDVKAMKNRTRNLLFLVATLLILVALAQPVMTLEKVKVQTKSSDVMVALDISDSMLAEDITPSRLRSAKQKVLDMLEVKSDERFGIMAFAKEAYLVAPLSFDHKALTFLLRQLDTKSITEKGTDFKQLIFSANEMLHKNENKYLLILSDGGDQESFEEEIALANEYGIKIFVLAVATTKGAPIKTKDGFIKYQGNILISHLNEAIKTLALQTGGAYVEASSSSNDIKAMLREIESRTKKSTLDEDEVTHYKQLFYYPLVLAMLFILIATSSLRQKSSALVLVVVLFTLPSDVKADLFDFQLLREAQAAYEAEDYNKSAQLYGDYASRHNDMDALFNHADALYKAKNYKEAEKNYEKIIARSSDERFNKNYNLGNALAKQANLEALKKAVSYYEIALKERDDLHAKENLEAVKEAIKKLEEQKKQEQNQESNDKQKNQDKQNDKQQDKNKENQEKDSQDNNKKSDDKQDSQDKKEQKSSKDEEKSNEQKQDSKDSKSQQEKNHDEKKSEQNKAQPSDVNDTKKEKQEEQKSKASEKKDEEKQAEHNATQALAQDPNEMSDKESQKQLMRIMKNRPGHLYQMKAMRNRSSEEQHNEKPW